VSGTPVNVEPDPDLPTGFHLDQNFPNPFNPTTTIRITLPERMAATLSIYDMLGRRVATILDGLQEMGETDFIFDASHLASGVYYYRLQAGALFETRKLVFIR
jgi:hypothetical protein